MAYIIADVKTSLVYNLNFKFTCIRVAFDRSKYNEMFVYEFKAEGE